VPAPPVPVVIISWHLPRPLLAPAHGQQGLRGPGPATPAVIAARQFGWLVTTCGHLIT
jgi:hypothetical protein